MHVHLKIHRIYFFRYQENSHPENFNQSNCPLVNSPLENCDPENSRLEYPTHVFKYLHPSFLTFFHYCHHYHCYYVKDCFAILFCKDCVARLFCKGAEVFMFVNIRQNEGLSEERQLMK